MAKTAVAEKKKTNVVKFDYGDDATATDDDLSADDFLLPFIRIIQDNSPEIKRAEEKYIPGVEAGWFLNTGAREAYNPEDGLKFVYACKEKVYVEFYPRDSSEGDGFVGARSADDPEVQRLVNEQGQFRSLDTGSGTELTETQNVYGILVREGHPPDMACLQIYSTGLTPYKVWMKELERVKRTYKAPLFATLSRLETVSAKNRHGSFFKWKIHLAGETPGDYLLSPDDELYQLAKRLRESVDAGKTRVDYAQSDVATGEAASDDPDDEIPF